MRLNSIKKWKKKLLPLRLFLNFRYLKYWTMAMIFIIDNEIVVKNIRINVRAVFIMDAITLLQK